MIISFALLSVASYVTQLGNAGLWCLEFYVLIFCYFFKQTNCMAHYTNYSQN